MTEFSHIDSENKVKMVDVSEKEVTCRTATARGEIILTAELIGQILNRQLDKGDLISAAKIAAISAAKKTWELIPLCHQIKLESVAVEISVIGNENKVEVISTVKGSDKTGVEMEALTAVSVALLTIYDMCKAVTKEMKIKDIMLIEKTGGRSGRWKSGGTL
jgi:cyclic pyranopterin phosphate synthase